MIELDNKTKFLIDEDTLNVIASSLTNKNIELIVTNDKEIKEINKQCRNIDKATDVLSFPYEEMPMTPLGSIVISFDHVELFANKLTHSNDDEFNLLFIHGLLHLLGYDHEVDNGEMRQEEERLITKFNLPKSLIIRTQG